MSIGERTYYFGRLNIAAMYDNKTEYVINAFRQGVRLEERGNIWEFIDVSRLEYNNDIYIHAFLTKYRKLFPEEIVNPDTSQSEQGVIENLIIAKSSFFLHIKSGTIAYQASSNQIRSKQFDSQFCKLFEKAHNHFFVDTDIQAINERGDFIERINEFQTIKKISFKLHPSNPRSHPIWKSLDDDIKAIGASKYTEEYSSKKDGSNSLNIDRIRLSEEIRSKIEMANDGYGKASFSGLINGEFKTITTSGNPIKATVLIREKVEDVFDSVKSSFDKILRGLIINAVKLENIKYILLSWDFPLSIAIGALLYFLLPETVPNAFAKDVYGVAISILSIIFPLHFAALTIIMSSSDDSFVLFLEEKNRYTAIIFIFRFSLLSLFAALVFSIFAYVNTLVLTVEGFSDQRKYLFSIFASIFSYGLCATLTTTLDAITYGLMRSKFLRAKKATTEAKSNKENK
ncbi:MAG: DUF4747 family protein [Lyngbya sp. HA4199-MV5]|jgi:uncharacterized membrane protein|nr:DUF4747 family protein [Lyngbya sp. HA4199-MV5]